MSMEGRSPTRWKWFDPRAAAALVLAAGSAVCLASGPDPSPAAPAPASVREPQTVSVRPKSQRSPAACPGDVNGDHIVNVFDLGLLLSNFGTTCVDDGGDGTPVPSSKLGAIAHRVIDGGDAQATRCMLAIFGDSMQEWSNSVLGGATYSIGIRDTWRCNWIGAAVHPDGGKNDIVGRHFALGSAFIGGWSGYDDPVPDQPAWSPGAPASLGDVRAPSTPNGFVYSCTAAGWCGGAEPAWPINLGCSVQDGSATWTAFALAGNYYPIASVARSPSFTPTCVMTTSPTAPMISAYSQFARLATEPGELTQFNSTGDWSSNNLACDMIFYRCPTGFRGDAGGDADTFSLVSLRGGAVANTASGLTCFSPAGSEQWAAGCGPCRPRRPAGASGRSPSPLPAPRRGSR